MKPFSQEEENDRQPCTVRVRFLKAWGHPTRNLIMGTGQTALVSERIADILTNDGTAERISR